MGIYGARHLFDVLIEGGRADVAETVLQLLPLAPIPR